MQRTGEGAGEAEVLGSGKRAAGGEVASSDLPQTVPVPEVHRSQEAKKAKQRETAEKGQGDRKR